MFAIETKGLSRVQIEFQINGFIEMDENPFSFAVESDEHRGNDTPNKQN